MCDLNTVTPVPGMVHFLLARGGIEALFESAVLLGGRGFLVYRNMNGLGLGIESNRVVRLLVW